MLHLSVNVDYVAVIRESRKTVEPDPIFAAGIVEMAGAHGITAHLREDRRHIVDRDIRLLREVVRLPFNLEMAATEGIIKIACDVVPDQVTFVPEKREEITTEGGLDVVGNRETLVRAVDRIKEKGIETSMFIDPDPKQIEMSREIGAQCVELHTGEYANAQTVEEAQKHHEALQKGATFASDCGLEVHAGHGLTYNNIFPIIGIKEIEGYYIGHSIMARAIYVGLDRAVRDMISIMKDERG
ncbi:MAG: pyridoxine 5'-phosphate synthase [Candidatus Latescibacteria bacterium]|jgi:pyridoxine 5-phosphate synthase|nr:pyridoxine 5'-phosphate synthase [Candidatus Latescibacterota bacterium]